MGQTELNLFQKVAKYGAGSTYTFGAHWITPVFGWVRAAQSIFLNDEFIFCCKSLRC